jgi:hypothetical protein
MTSFRIKVIDGIDVEGEVLLVDEPVSFLGDLNPESGELRGYGSIKGKVLIIPVAVGSTVGSYVLYSCAMNGCGPKALVLEKPDAMTITGAIIAGIPIFQLLDSWDLLKSHLSTRQKCKARIYVNRGEMTIE